jgi:hypothetical protein
VADSKESFEILENSSGDGTAASEIQEGTAASSKRGLAAFTHKDSGTGNYKVPVVNTSGQTEVDVKTSVLPTGAATAANQATEIASLASIDGKTPALVSGRQPVDGSGVTQPISAAALPLPSGASTEATLVSVLAALNFSTTAPGFSAQGLIVRQVPYELATFSVVAELITVGNNKSMIAIQNTGTSILKLREVWIINDRTTAVTGVAGEFRLHRITSFTGGTAITPVSFDTNDSLPAGITVATNSTVSGESSLLRTGKWSTDEWGTGTTDVESTDHAFQQVEPFWRQIPSGKPITLRQNQGAHIRFATNSTAGEFNLRFVFTTET